MNSRAIWALALPAMLTNVATALFGLADLWVIGRLGDAGAQGAVELGARFITSLLVVFNFLRTGTTALTAQTSGQGGEQVATLARALILAGGIAAVLVAAGPWIVPPGLGWLGARGDVAGLAGAYIARRYWAVPAALANGALAGWLVGQRRVRAVLAAEVGANIVHIALDLGLVLGLHWGVAGVATASALSEWLKLAFLVAMVARQGDWGARGAVWRASAFRHLLVLNRDLFLRTLLLTGVMLEFTRAGAQVGAVTLAANAILFQMFMLSALILDGFETAAQVLCGEAAGQRDGGRFRAAVRACLWPGWMTGVGIAVVYALAGGRIAASFSLDPAVRDAAAQFVPWAAALPVLGVTSFVLDGVFVGAGWARAMLGVMAVSFALFNAALHLFAPLGNHGLWLAFCLLFVARAGGQAICLPGLARRHLRL